MSESLWAWIGFGVLIVTLLVLDMAVFHRRLHTPTIRESAGWSVFWIGLAVIFNVLFWRWKVWNEGPQAGNQAGLEFLTGYLVEKSLSMDNVFVFAVIFKYFRVELQYQYRVLFWGVLVAILTRLAFILAGAELVHRFGWVLPAFGIFLVYTAIKLAMHDETQVDPEQNWLLRLARRFLSVTREMHGERFFVREGGRLCITPLFLVLLVIESTDVLFAVDSVPAIFGITKDPFIVFSSNIFAIMGLRALYFLLATVIDMFRYLNYGLSAVLAFVGVKMIAAWWFPHQIEIYVPAWVSLIVVVTLLAVSIVASLAADRRDRRRMPPTTNTED